MSYDEKCKALAWYFLSDVELADSARLSWIEDLAQHIQDEIETWLSIRLDEPVPSPSSPS